MIIEGTEKAKSAIGSFHGIVNPGLEIVSDSLLYRLLFHLLAAIGAKLIGTYGGLQVVKNGRYWRNRAHGVTL